ncbi:MAG: FitA-like ribbon-helix-helix domain-containing protein [Geminicoccales bacterium]
MRVDDELIRALKIWAAKHGCSAEAEDCRILA